MSLMDSIELVQRLEETRCSSSCGMEAGSLASTSDLGSPKLTRKRQNPQLSLRIPAVSLRGADEIRTRDPLSASQRNPIPSDPYP